MYQIPGWMSLHNSMEKYVVKFHSILMSIYCRELLKIQNNMKVEYVENL